MRSNFRKALVALAATAALLAGTVGVAQSSNADDARANGLKITARANGL